jgi:hypothetical protein
MAVETLTRTRCDRCKNVVEETPVVAQADGDTKKPLLYVEQQGHPPIKFEDLCPKCADRVDNLCVQLRLEKDDKKPAAAAPTPSEEPKKSTKGNKDKKDKGQGSDAPPAN